MGALDKFMKFMKIDDEAEDEEEYGGYDDDDYDETEEEETPVRTQDTSAHDDTSHINIRNFPPKGNQKGKKMINPENNPSVCVFKPTNVAESREITNTLRQNKTVVLNLEDADDMSAQRILDFTSGSCYALDGTLQKISNYIFIITPASVVVSGDFQDSITESFGL